MRHAPTPARTLRAFAARPDATAIRCDLCARAIDTDHEHAWSVRDRSLACVCHACGLLLQPDRGVVRRLHRRMSPVAAGSLGEALWNRLAIPVSLACFVNTAERGLRALYPGPLGLVEAELDRDAWQSAEGLAAAVSDLKRDTDALLVHRTPTGTRCFHVSIDVVYALAGLIRRHRATSSGAIEACLRELIQPARMEGRA